MRQSPHHRPFSHSAHPELDSSLLRVRLPLGSFSELGWYTEELLGDPTQGPWSPRPWPLELNTKGSPMCGNGNLGMVLRS